MWQPGQHRNRLPVTAEINVTSLVDVAFTLLVIFIITAPILQGGVEVELPRAEAGPISSTQGVVVTMGAEGVSQIVARRLTRDVEGPARPYVRRVLHAIPGGAAG